MFGVFLRCKLCENELSPASYLRGKPIDPHGLVTFQNAVKRRLRKGRSLIDRRSTAGKNVVAVRDEIFADLGGAEGLAATKLVLVEVIAKGRLLSG
jgi:hypothetical protein